MSDAKANPEITIEVTPQQGTAVLRSIELAQPVPWPKDWEDAWGVAAKACASNARYRLSRAPGARRVAEDRVALTLDFTHWLEVLGEIVRSVACGHLTPEQEQDGMESIRVIREVPEIKDPSTWVPSLHERLDDERARLQRDIYRLRGRIKRLTKILEVLG